LWLKKKNESVIIFKLVIIKCVNFKNELLIKLMSRFIITLKYKII